MSDIVKKSPFDNVQTFELAQRVAKSFASSALVPTQYQGNVPNTLIAMEIASRIGASVLAVMQHLYIIGGRPAFDSTFLIATVNGSGKFSPLQFEFYGEEGDDDWGCRAVATNLANNEICRGSKITMRMAHDEGWYSKRGSKWQTMPEHMLKFRAASFWTREFAPELSLGMQTVDEVRDARSEQDAVTLDEIADRVESEIVDSAECREDQS